MEVVVVVLIKVDVKVSNGCDNNVGGGDNNSDVGGGGGGDDNNNDGDGNSDDRGKDCQWMKINNDNSNYYNLWLNNLNNFKIINM